MTGISIHPAIGATTPACTPAGLGPPAPRVYVASPVRLLRETLADQLEEKDGVLMLGSGDLAAAAEAAPHLAPDVLLLDVTAAASLDVARRVLRACPALRVVAFAVAEEPTLLLACAQAGVSGYLARDASIAQVVDTVRRTNAGEPVCPPALVALILAHAAGARPETVRLTAREHEVATLLAGGLSNKHIARRLSLANATVKNHVHKILEKLRLERRGEVAAQYLGLAADISSG